MNLFRSQSQARQGQHGHYRHESTLSTHPWIDHIEYAKSEPRLSKLYNLFELEYDAKMCLEYE